MIRKFLNQKNVPNTYSKLEVSDTDGKLFRKEIVEVAKNKGSGWVDYKYMNPEARKVEHKTTYILRVEDTIICCGAYK